MYCLHMPCSYHLSCADAMFFEIEDIKQQDNEIGALRLQRVHEFCHLPLPAPVCNVDLVFKSRSLVQLWYVCWYPLASSYCLHYVLSARVSFAKPSS